VEKPVGVVGEPELLANVTLAEGGGEENATSEEPTEEILISENFHFLNIVLTVISFTHALVSLAFLIAYYQLKVTWFPETQKPCSSSYWTSKKIHNTS